MEHKVASLSPRKADKMMIEGEGGSYYSWSSSNYPILGEANVGAGRLLLHPKGFAVPHYADSSKIGYVLQGSCTVGILTPKTMEEKIIRLEEGNEISIPMGVISWWFNGGDNDMIVIYIGETSKGHVPGEFTYFILAGGLSFISGFSTEFVARAYGMNNAEAKKLATSQPDPIMIVKLEEAIAIPEGENIEGNAELVSTLAEQVGLSANMVKLGGSAAEPAMFAADGSTKLIYVAKGTGKVQIVDMTGKLVLDATLSVGDLVVMPRFYVFMQAADEDGLECFSVVTSPRPVFRHLSGERSIWKVVATKVVETALGVSSDTAEKLALPN